METLWQLLFTRFRKTPASEVLRLCEAMERERSRKLSDSDYTVYASGFLSLTRLGFAVSTEDFTKKMSRDNAGTKTPVTCRHEVNI